MLEKGNKLNICKGIWIYKMARFEIVLVFLGARLTFCTQLYKYHLLKVGSLAKKRFFFRKVFFSYVK